MKKNSRNGIKIKNVMMSRKKTIVIVAEDSSENIENILIIGLICAIVIILFYFSLSLFPISLLITILEVLLAIVLVCLPVFILYFYFKKELDKKYE